MTDRDIQIFRAPLRHLTGVQVLGVGSYVPDVVVNNEDLARLGCDPEWIIRRTGIRERRHAPPEMATSDMAVLAARRCIEQAGVRMEDIDLLVLATFTPDMPMPSTACIVQNRLGLCAPAMDIQAACAGFIYALVTGMQFVATGCSKLALVIGADCNSKVADPDDPKTYPLFGDAAGAVLIGPGAPEQGLIAYTLGADGSGFDLLCCPLGGSRMPITPALVEQRMQYIKMDGRPVFKWAVRLLTATITEILAAASMTVADVDLVVLHQANARIIDAAVDALGLDRSKVIVNLDRYGNTSAGSIPLALDECYQAGRIRRGDTLLISGFGGGLTWGTTLLRW